MTFDRHADQQTSADGDSARPTAASVACLAVADDPSPLGVSLLAAALCLAVGLVHVQDQGGFLGHVTPGWIAISYYAVEIGAAITIPFIVRQKTVGWVLGALVSIGPCVAYILSRTVGLPGDTGDVGNWGYTLGTVSLVVEGSLFLLSMTSLLRVASSLRPARPRPVLSGT